MFIKIKNIKNYLEKKHQKEIDEKKREYEKYIRKINKKHESEINDLKSFYNNKIKEKNREILRLKHQKENYIDKSLEYDINLERVERLRNYILDEMGGIVKECEHILESDIKNYRFVLKNEHRFRSK